MPLEEIFLAGFVWIVEGHQDVFESLDIQAADDSTGVCNGDSARLLRDNYCDGIGNFRDTNRGAVTKPHLPFGRAGQDAAG